MPADLARASIGHWRLGQQSAGEPRLGTSRGWAFAALASAIVLVAWNGLSRDLSEAEATLGLAAIEPIGPFGQVLGGWLANLPVGRVLPSWLTARVLGPESAGWPGLVHLPAVLASIAMVVLIARRAWQLCGSRTSALVAIALSSGLALNERPFILGFDPVVGLVVVAAIDRILARGSDLIAGCWTALAVLMSGWPAVIMVFLPTFVFGRRQSYLSWRLVLPPLIAMACWSAWALSTVPALAWGEALIAPLKQPVAWGLVPSVLAFGLPWSPFAVLAISARIRHSWSEMGRRWLVGWLQVAGVAALAGTLLPGLSRVAAVPMVVALTIVACASLERAVACQPARAARIYLFVLGLVIVASTSVACIAGLAYLAAVVPYYRMVGVVIAAVLTLLLAFAVVGAMERRAGWMLGCLLALSVCVKAAHAEIYSPEWNYRAGRGPEGRAIGQWVPPRKPIHAFHPWPAELAFATRHQVRTLVSPGWLKFVADVEPHYVLLLLAEFENWPDDAPRIVKIREFEDMWGRSCILARTARREPKA